MEKVGSQVVYAEYLQQSCAYIVGGKTLIIITTAGLWMEMFFLPHKVQECKKLLGYEGSLNFLKHFILLSLKKKKNCMQNFSFS